MFSPALSRRDRVTVGGERLDHLLAPETQRLPRAAVVAAGRLDVALDAADAPTVAESTRSSARRPRRAQLGRPCRGGVGTTSSAARRTSAIDTSPCQRWWTSSNEVGRRGDRLEIVDAPGLELVHELRAGIGTPLHEEGRRRAQACGSASCSFHWLRSKPQRSQCSTPIMGRNLVRTALRSPPRVRGPNATSSVGFGERPVGVGAAVVELRDGRWCRSFDESTGSPPELLAALRRHLPEVDVGRTRARFPSSSSADAVTVAIVDGSERRPARRHFPTSHSCRAPGPASRRSSRLCPRGWRSPGWSIPNSQRRWPRPCSRGRCISTGTCRGTHDSNVPSRGWSMPLVRTSERRVGIVGLGALGRRPPTRSPTTDSPSRVVAIGERRSTAWHASTVSRRPPHAARTDPTSWSTCSRTPRPRPRLLGAEAFAAMPDRCIARQLRTWSRRSTTHALLDALDRGHLDHAVLDVFDVEPLPGDHPYLAPRVGDGAPAHLGADQRRHRSGDRRRQRPAIPRHR